MKHIYVIRHAPKNADQRITDEGRLLIEKAKHAFKTFDIVISSEMPRAKETAQLLTGRNPIIDTRANIIDIDLEQEKKLFELGKAHPHGIAGVIFATPEYKRLVKERGESLAGLIKETMRELSDNQKALIISHDAPMVAAENILQGKSFDAITHGFKPLHGFIVDQNLHLSSFYS